jgi:hypothetical protein
MIIEVAAISPKDETIVPMTFDTKTIKVIYGIRVDETEEIGTACLVERHDGAMLVIAEPYNEFRDKYMPIKNQPDLFSQPEEMEG